MMKRKAEKNVSPTTPDTQTGWLRSRREAPSSPPGGPPSPSPLAKPRNGIPGLDSSWVQLGGVSQADHVDDELDSLWVSSFGDSSGQAAAVPTTATTSGGPRAASNGRSNALLQQTSPRHNDPNVPAKSLSGQNPNSSTTAKPSLDVELKDQSEDYENSVIKPTLETRSTNNGLNTTSNFPPIHSSSIEIIMLPSTDLSRPLAPGDEVHLLDDNNSDSTGQITYKVISNIDSKGFYTIAPIPTSLRCPSTRLIRAPLTDGDIVSVFQNVIVEVNSVQQVRSEQMDWGAIVKRWVVDGERRYNVVSWDDKWAGRLWEGLRDAELGQYDIQGTHVVGREE